MTGMHKNPFISIFFILQTLSFYTCHERILLYWQKRLGSATSSFLFYSIQSEISSHLFYKRYSNHRPSMYACSTKPGLA